MEEDATVALADRDAEAAEQTAAELGERTCAQAVNVTSRSEVRETVRAVVERYGRLDILVKG